ncbi:hypothetical protein [Bosea thiooxidans]
MTIPFLALALIIAVIPALGMVDTLPAIGAILTILAVALATTAFAMPAVKLRRFAHLMQPALLAMLAAPALWMTIQLLPMPVQALGNQIWASAASALNQPLAGAITVDIGATLLSLAQYCLVAVVMIVAAAVALDEQRATELLYLLIAVATVVATRLIFIELEFFGAAPSDSEELVLIAVVGTVLSCAGALRLYDQLRQTDRSRRADTGPVPFFAAACIAFVICSTAVLIRGEAGAIVAALLAIATLGAAFVIRRWSLGLWGKAGLAVTAFVVLLGAAAIVPIRRDIDPAVAGAVQSQIATERILADVPFAGAGAGAYEALLPIYSDIGSKASASPTTAAVIVIEMGRAFFGGLIVAILCCAWLLFGRALKRRQDYAFACAGAAILAAVPLLLFVNGGALGLGASLLAGVAGGLTFGQSLSSRDIAKLPPQPVPPRALLTSDAPSELWPRGALALLALMLILQAVWILGAEGYEFGRHRLMRQANSADATHDGIRKAAAFAVVRGDLWARSVRAQIARREADIAAGPASTPMLAREDLERALRYAPHRSDAWLMLALLAERDRLAGYDARALLKMSYYTAPNDIALLPLRLDLALSVETKASDTELQDLIRRDISLIVRRQPGLRPVLAAAYRSAAPPQRSTAERLIFEVDPDYLKSIRMP